MYTDIQRYIFKHIKLYPFNFHTIKCKHMANYCLLLNTESSKTILHDSITIQDYLAFTYTFYGL